MIPSLVADTSLSDKEKIQRLAVYTRSLEMLYEPLQLEPIGDPGEKTTFNPRFHESGANISSGDPCLIKRIGFTKGDSVIRKAVVEEVQE
jgi:molecular chaperone GrpE (heat shock protein)